jgi:hypothetical protein
MPLESGDSDLCMIRTNSEGCQRIQRAISWSVRGNDAIHRLSCRPDFTPQQIMRRYPAQRPHEPVDAFNRRKVAPLAKFIKRASGLPW